MSRGSFFRGSRLVGLAAVGVGALLMVVPGLAHAETISSPDPDPGSGDSAAMVVDTDGNPAVAYFNFGVPSKVSLLRCDDPACTGAGEVVTVVDTDVGEPDRVVSLAIDAANNPVLTYEARGEIRLLSCDDPFCHGGNDVPLRVDGGRSPAMVLDADDRPVVAYAGGARGAQDLLVLSCNDPTCSAGVPELVDSAQVIFSPSIVLDREQRPALAYGYLPVGTTNFLETEMRVVRCNDPACAGGDETKNTIETSDPQLLPLDPVRVELALDHEDRPVILDSTGVPELLFLWCNDIACAGGDDQFAPLINSWPGAWSGSLALATTGDPTVLYKLGGGGTHAAPADPDTALRHPGLRRRITRPSDRTHG